MTSPRLISNGARVRRSPFCASRASTVSWRWRRPSMRAGFECVDVHHVATSSRAGSSWRASAGWRPAAAFPMATCWAPARAGPRPSSSTRGRASSSRRFFERPDTFALGICNGCQMLSNLRELIPGADHWPHFVRNRSEQFEARTLTAGGRRDAVGAAGGDGRVTDADRGRPWRGPRRVPRCRTSGWRASECRRALCGERRAGGRTLSGQPQRLSGRDRRPDHDRMGGSPS